MHKQTYPHQVDRVPGVNAALEYLGLMPDALPVIGRTTHKFPKKKPNKWLAKLAAFKLRFG